MIPRISVLPAPRPNTRHRGEEKTGDLGNEVELGLCDVSFGVFALFLNEFFENRKFFEHFCGSIGNCTISDLSDEI